MRKVVIQQQKDWDEHIPRFLLSYRSAIHDLTSKSPAKVIFGTEIKLSGDLEFDVTYNGKEQRLNELHEFVLTRKKWLVTERKAGKIVQ